MHVAVRLVTMYEYTYMYFKLNIYNAKQRSNFMPVVKTSHKTFLIKIKWLSWLLQCWLVQLLKVIAEDIWLRHLGERVLLIE